MNIYQIFLISYLVLAFVIAVAMFLLRRAFSSNRAEVMPSIIASLLSGLAWGIALPLAVKVCLHRDREEKGEEKDEL